MAKNVRVGVAGVGALGKIHARIYAEMPDIEFVGVADIDRDAANSISDLYNCEAYGDARELLPRVDAVSVVVRPEDVYLSDQRSVDGDNMIVGEIAEVVFMGESLDCTVTAGEETMRLKLHPSTRVEAGQTINLALPVDRCRALAT